MYNMLNKIVNPRMAPMEIQNPQSPVNKPLDLRIASPTVDALIDASVFVCSKNEKVLQY